MIIKELGYQGLIKYYGKIEAYLLEKYQKEFKASKENVKKIIDKKLDSLKCFIKKENAFLIGAIEEDELLAFIWIYQHNYFDEKRLHINELMVEEAHRKKGIARSLLKEAEKKARSLDIDVLDLLVSEDNHIARNIYDKMGYQTERRQLRLKLD